MLECFHAVWAEDELPSSGVTVSGPNIEFLETSQLCETFEHDSQRTPESGLICHLLQATNLESTWVPVLLLSHELVPDHTGHM